MRTLRRCGEYRLVKTITGYSVLKGSQTVWSGKSLLFGREMFFRMTIGRREHDN